MKNKSVVKGKFCIEQIRNGKKIEKREFRNGITEVGFNSLLDIMFHGSAQLNTWYLGLIDNSGFVALSSSDTMASHSGWNENEDYSESTRVEWAEDAASGQVITNSVAATFNINASVAIKGAFLVSENTKGGSSGTLWCTAAFTSVLNLVASDQLKITYTFNIAEV